MKFSDSTKLILAAGGWSETRRSNVREAENLAKTKGFPVFAAWTDFVSRFGDLSFANPAAIPPALEEWHFRAAETINDTPLNNLKYYETQLGLPVAIIGKGSDDYLLFLINEAGVIFGAFDEQIFQIGITPEDAIEAICSGRRFVAVDS
ncbi:SUKH-3 domain-containing protein [Zavarzinella formosa]|uniref:SUKH-3 domain-containing protein n=1 Tax=Zavarzinella formosa TaxID=360055 RepID=UPI000300B075|nr:SUKH-3 domain-containing protein [Zavarzinella formosa]